jgi:hypothetical protein
MKVKRCIRICIQDKIQELKRLKMEPQRSMGASNEALKAKDGALEGL